MRYSYACLFYLINSVLLFGSTRKGDAMTRNVSRESRSQFLFIEQRRVDDQKAMMSSRICFASFCFHFLVPAAQQKGNKSDSTTRRCKSKRLRSSNCPNPKVLLSSFQEMLVLGSRRVHFPQIEFCEMRNASFWLRFNFFADSRDIWTFFVICNSVQSTTRQSCRVVTTKS